MVNHVTVPAEFVTLASEWYSGTDLLYAIASTGNLTLGNRRPWNDDESRSMTDEEWYANLFSNLAADLRSLLRQVKRHKDVPKLQRFLEWAETQEDVLQSV